MKLVYEALKNFILNDMAEPLKKMEVREGEYPLPDAKNIVYGTFCPRSKQGRKTREALIPE